MNNEITQDQELEAAREMRKSKLQALKEKGLEMAKEEIKKQVKRKIIYYILSAIGSFLLATWWIWLGLLVFFVIVYFIVNPCELSSIVGTWWADLLGKACKGAKEVMEAIK